MKHRRRANQPNAGLTPSQMVILILFAVLSISTLALAGYVLLGDRLAAPSAPPVAQVEPNGPNLPPTWTVPANIETPPASTTAPAQMIPALPASCAQSGSGFHQGRVNRVINGSTLEVQDGENVFRVGYAGIDVAQGSANSTVDQAAAQKARELVEGQPVVLVKDVSEQDPAGRLLRYVFSGSRFINFEMVRAGYASVLTNAPDQACTAFLGQAQQQARVEKNGIWQSSPVPTRTFVPFVTLAPKDSTCDCSVRYLCSDFRTRADAQECLNVCNDYSSKLDMDRDGIACENEFP